MAEISQITLPSGITYDIKDATARQAIVGGMIFMGVSSTAITDGGTQTPTIDGSPVTPLNGYVVIYDGAEFVWTEPTGGSGHWSEFGDTSDLGDLAYQDTASGSYTPNGSVSATFTGTPVRLLTSPITTVREAYLETETKSISVSGTPTGTVSQPTFTGTGVRLVTSSISTADSASFSGTEGTVNVSGNISGSVTGASFTGTGVRLVTGNISVPSSATFTGSLMNSEGSVTVNDYTLSSGSDTTEHVTVASASGTADYTPAGTVSAPTLTRTAGSTTTIKNPTSTNKVASVVTANAGATAPSNPLSYATIDGERLILNQIGYTTGATITTSNVTVKTGDTTYTASAPTFTGTGVNITYSKTGAPSLNQSPTTKEVVVSGTPSGSISFTNTNKTATVSPAASGTATYTPAGTVTGGSISVTGATMSGTFTPSGTVSLTKTGKTATVSPASSGTATYTPAGTVSKPTFSGTSFDSTGYLSDYANGIYLDTESYSYVVAQSQGGGDPTYTPAGTVSATFTGTSATITVS